MAVPKLAVAFLAAATLAAQGPPRGFPGGPGGFPGPPGGGRQGDDTWHRNAYFGELETFDSCFGHQPPSGEYHNHVQPVCLRAQLDDNLEIVHTGRTGSSYSEKISGWQHSPILGWSFDGYPIYGPYGYSDPRDPKSPVRRVKSSFRLRQITVRDTILDWAGKSHDGAPQRLDATRQGPPVNDKFPLGRYVEDYEYVAGLGDLDQYNGRFTVTPQFPKGTYAYFVTIDQEGKPAFPFILGLEYYGNPSGGRARYVPQDVQDYFNPGGASAFTPKAAGRKAEGRKAEGRGEPTGDVLLKSWFTQNSSMLARAVNSWDPSAGPQTTWPVEKPEGGRAFGGVSTPTRADVQRIRTNDDAVYVNSNNLPSYVIGPWFEARNGGVFQNFAAPQHSQVRIPRQPQAATSAHVRTPLGPIGMWVNGVAVFNALDAASYSRASGNDAGGGIVATAIVQVSTASLEGGPAAPGSLVTAYADFDAKLATSVERAKGAAWPITLGGATVTIRDSAGVSHKAAISYASPARIDYRIPEAVAPGLARVSIDAGGASIPGELNIVPVYPGLFEGNTASLATAPVCRSERGGQKMLILYGTGFSSAKDVSVTVAGQRIERVLSEPQKDYPGVDRIEAVIPPGAAGESVSGKSVSGKSVAGNGKVEVIVTAGGKPSNPVHVVIE